MLNTGVLSFYTDARACGDVLLIANLVFWLSMGFVTKSKVLFWKLGFFRFRSDHQIQAQLAWGWRLANGSFRRVVPFLVPRGIVHIGPRCMYRLLFANDFWYVLGSHSFVFGVLVDRRVVALFGLRTRRDLILSKVHDDRKSP